MLTKLSTRGQLVLPKELRDRLGWQPGTRLELVERGDRIEIRAAEEPAVGTWDDVIGLLAGDRGPLSVEEMDDAVSKMFRGRPG